GVCTNGIYGGHDLEEKDVNVIRKTNPRWAKRFSTCGIRAGIQLLIMCGDMFKDSNSYLKSKGSFEDFVSFREMITSQLQGKLWLYDEVQDIKINAFEVQVEDAKVEKYQVDESEVDEVVVSEPQVYEVDVDAA
ncbi:hypothetical protein Tco_1328198, partial [Tanacetum coccineum]